MYTTVVVPLDGSELAERALGPAAEVASETGASLVALMVTRGEPFERHQAYLEARTRDLGVEVQPPYLIEAADPAECIANAAEAEGSLVVMTTHGSSGARRAVFGSVAEKALRLLGSPMLMVGPSYIAGPRLRGGKMLVAIDGSQPATAILPTAASWARTFEMEPWVVTVHDPSGEGALAAAVSRGDVSESAPAKRVAADLEKLGVQAEWEVLHGAHPDGPIVTYALDLPASLIAMTTHGRTGLARIAVGSTTMKVLHDASCPVLLTRPDGLLED